MTNTTARAPQRPPPAKGLLTPAEARDWIRYTGVSVAHWSRMHGFSIKLVHELLGGRKKGTRGQAHNVAVALRLKDGVPTNVPGRLPSAPSVKTPAQPAASEGMSA